MSLSGKPEPSHKYISFPVTSTSFVLPYFVLNEKKMRKFHQVTIWGNLVNRLEKNNLIIYQNINSFLRDTRRFPLLGITQNKVNIYYFQKIEVFIKGKLMNSHREIIIHKNFNNCFENKPPPQKENQSLKIFS